MSTGRDSVVATIAQGIASTQISIGWTQKYISCRIHFQVEKTIQSGRQSICTHRLFQHQWQRKTGKRRGFFQSSCVNRKRGQSSKYTRLRWDVRKREIKKEILYLQVVNIDMTAYRSIQLPTKPTPRSRECVCLHFHSTDLKKLRKKFKLSITHSQRKRNRQTRRSRSKLDRCHQ